MEAILNILILLACIVALWFGAVWVVEAAARIARRLGLSELVIGLTIVAIGTSAPEFAVTIAAALRGQADISVGNVVGSNIFNLGFILGGVALVRAISTTRSLIWRDGMVLIGATFLLLFFLRDLTLSRAEGVILMGSLVAYVGYLIYQREEVNTDEIPEGEFNWPDILRLLGGLLLITAGGHFLVEAASSLARLAGVSDWVIGVTIVAAGTSMPEMATSLIAVMRGHYGISAGNLLGSDLFNLLGVLGLAAFMRPLTVDRAAYSSLFLLSGLVIMVVIMLRTDWKLSRREGFVLVTINLVRWIVDFGIR
jgi:cation:H+ antiporter